MTDLQWLYAVLWFLYLLECVVWVPRGAVAWTRWGRRWRMAFPSATLGNSRGGLVITPPVPALPGALLSSSVPPLSCGPAGVLASASMRLDPGPRVRHAGSFFGWEAIRDVRVRGKRLCIGRDVLARFGSEVSAWDIRNRLYQAAVAADADRAGLLQSWANDLMDRAALDRCWQSFRSVVLPLTWCCRVNFAVLFGLTPLTVMAWGLDRTWPLLAVLIGSLAVLTWVFFRRAHGRLYPEADEERFTQGLMILLSPPLAVRAVEGLGRPLTERWHPLTLAAVFGKETVRTQLGRRVLKELRYPARPAAPSEPAAAVGVDQAWRGFQYQAAECLLREMGYDPERLLCPPEPEGEGCRAYCPRCDTQFTTPTGSCRDCGGVPLEPLGGGADPVERCFPPDGLPD